MQKTIIFKDLELNTSHIDMDKLYHIQKVYEQCTGRPIGLAELIISIGGAHINAAYATTLIDNN